MEDPREKFRLAEKVDAEKWVTQYVEPRISTSKKILDVGCGPGALVQAVAEQYQNAQVTGLEQSADRYAAASKNLESFSNASVVQGDAYNIPFQENEFDFVYSRFMLQYLVEPGQAINEMVRTCRPGGKVMLQDLDGQFFWNYPIDKTLQSQLESVLEHMGTTGFDPFVGRKLFSMAKNAGLQEIDVKVEPYHLFAGSIDQDNYRLWELKLDIALPVIADALGGSKQAQIFKDTVLDYLSRDDSITYSVQFTVTGEKLRTKG